MEWNPFETHHGDDMDIPPSFITFGRKHIKLWNSEDPKGNSGWKAKQLSFGKFPMQVGLLLAVCVCVSLLLDDEGQNDAYLKV